MNKKQQYEVGTLSIETIQDPSHTVNDSIKISACGANHAYERNVSMRVLRSLNYNEMLKLSDEISNEIVSAGIIINSYCLMWGRLRAAVEEGFCYVTHDFKILTKNELSHASQSIAAFDNEKDEMEEFGMALGFKCFSGAEVLNFIKHNCRVQWTEKRETSIKAYKDTQTCEVLVSASVKDCCDMQRLEERGTDIGYLFHHFLMKTLARFVD